MPSGAVTIAEFPGEKIEIICNACARRGVYAKARLVERYGAETGLPNLLSQITQDCPARSRHGILRCGANYLALRAARAQAEEAPAVSSRLSTA
jgi:hypothetical protein